MPFTCVLCNEETCYLSNFCDDCQVIKRITNCYGKVEVKEILKEVCLRNKKQQRWFKRPQKNFKTYKINGIIKSKNELNEEIKGLKKN